VPRPISATVSLPALRHNLACLRGHLHVTAQTQQRCVPFIWAVIKANAYGHGVEEACQAFADAASAADGLAMLDLDEAVRCREAGWQKPILLLEGFFEPRDLAVVREYGLSVVLHGQHQLDMLAADRDNTAHALPLPVWIKLNTGMNRLGFAPDAFPRACTQLRQMQAQGKIASLGAMTHFARADDSQAATREQLRVFLQTMQTMAQHPAAPQNMAQNMALSVCNSAAALRPDIWPALPVGQQQWVRTGICLYGSSPFADRSAASLGLLPAMTLRSQLINVHAVKKGEGIGYGHTFTAEKDLRVGVVACGYADGYPRHAPSGTPVVVDGVRTRLLGRVSMDMLMVALDGIPSAGVGSAVTLWGEGGPSVDEVAQASGTIGYELLCAVAPRVPRRVQALPAGHADGTR